mmetsp:Transcript_3806/g.5912  ORF Transcript_3806/g.5912 Transcript_3806/m.5912 type:complete len:776 (+) Transcript_3806:85-2412(+)|eukprot:CAMPEP_0185028256 /NCGR_PEP_ID=MMETSP1103-20130426/13923_1 /TAXON_ID=36769 /ORGANISM="Paraphysomonas bandaiensis, Strain Caron Lab Isolate" /LENGTH=775 /DNA_ID=CAMNT_0027562631 /DNA_START=17 /DNA_END=2344 /DNA_ORIENTATION=-
MAAPLEVVDMIQQSLDESGVIRNIRSQLLSAVINLLNGTGDASADSSSSPIKDFKGTQQGMAALHLIAELLDVLGLGLTLSTFACESELSLPFPEKKSICDIADEYGLKQVDGQPLLLGILEKAKGVVDYSTKNPSTSSSKTSSLSRHRLGLSEAKHDLDHMEMVDSDLEESFSSIGSGRHAKTLAPLAQLSKSAPGLKEFPAPSANSGGKHPHLAPLAPLHSSKPLPQDRKTSPRASPKSSPESASHKSIKQDSPEKLSVGRDLEQSFESSMSAEEKTPLSPYYGSSAPGLGLGDGLDASAPDSPSFEDSSQVFEHVADGDISAKGTTTEASVEENKPSNPQETKNVVVAAVSQDKEEQKSVDTVRATTSSAHVTRSRLGWDDTDEVEEVMDSFEEGDDESVGSPSKKPQVDEDFDEEVEMTGNAVEMESRPDVEREDTVIDSVDTVSRLRPGGLRSGTREAFGPGASETRPQSSALGGLPPVSRPGARSLGDRDDWDNALSPTGDSEAFNDDDEYGSVDHEALDESGVLNVSRRSNQEEDEEEQKAIKKFDGVNKPILNPDNSDEDDYDDYGDDFEDGGDDDDAEVSIAESLEEELSFGAASSEGNSSGDEGFGGGMARTSSGLLPKPSEEGKRDGSLAVSDFDYNSDDSAGGEYAPSTGKRSSPKNQAQSNIKVDYNSSDDEFEFGGGPETGSQPGSDGDVLDFSVGEQSGGSLVMDEDMDEGSALKSAGGSRAAGDSMDFSMSEQEVSSSQGLDGFDYTTNAMPPSSRRGW